MHRGYAGSQPTRPLLAPNAPNYFALAWAQQARVGAGYGVALPPDDLSLAINSSKGRSQNQLHIHLDCIRPDVKIVLFFMRDAIGPNWHTLPQPLAGHPYRAMRINADALNAVTPFRLLAASLSSPATQMGEHPLALIPLDFADGPGFALLDDVADVARGDRASSEELQDYGCSVIAADDRVAAARP